MRMALKKWVFITGITLVLGPGGAWAQQGHDHGTGSPPTSGSGGVMSHHMPARPVQSAVVDGLKISVDVMGMGMHVQMQTMKGTPLPDTFDRKKGQAVMVMIESVATQKVVTDAEVTVTVVDPKGVATVAKAPWYGDHYGTGFGSEEDGTYRIRVEAVHGGIRRGAEFKHVE